MADKPKKYAQKVERGWLMTISLEAILNFLHGCNIHQFSGVNSGSSCGIILTRLKTANHAFGLFLKDKHIDRAVRADIDSDLKLTVGSIQIFPHALF